MTERLNEENYSAEETIMIKIPFKLPYQEEDSKFKRTQGDFQHHGEFYKLVKQRVVNDTLYIVCVKDNKEKKIFNFMVDMVKLSTALPTSSSTVKLLGSLIKDYLPLGSMTMLSQQGWSQSLFYEEMHFGILIRNHPIFSPPPDLLA